MELPWHQTSNSIKYGQINKRKTLDAQASKSKEDLLEVFKIFIRGRLEYCAPVWNPTLTEEDKEDIERIQKTALKIILGESYGGYETALDMCQLTTLEDRRESLCLNFALKCLSNENHKNMFPETNNELLHHPTKFQVPLCLHERYRKSPIPYLTNLLNEHYEKEEPNPQT